MGIRCAGLCLAALLALALPLGALAADATGTDAENLGEPSSQVEAAPDDNTKDEESEGSPEASLPDVIDLATETDGEELLRETVELGEAPEEVLSVTVPAEIPFMIDPYMLAGKTQIYSEEFVIENRSPVEVELTFTSLTCTFAKPEDFLSLERPFDPEDHTDRKEVYMELAFLNRELAPVVVTDREQAQPQSFVLAAADFHEDGTFATATDASRLTFHLTGSVNHEPEVNWGRGDVSITLRYRIEESILIEEPQEEEEDGTFATATDASTATDATETDATATDAAPPATPTDGTESGSPEQSEQSEPPPPEQPEESEVSVPEQSREDNPEGMEESPAGETPPEENSPTAPPGEGDATNREEGES